jgi:hypothetical protein
VKNVNREALNYSGDIHPIAALRADGSECVATVIQFSSPNRSQTKQEKADRALSCILLLISFFLSISSTSSSSVSSSFSSSTSSSKPW